MKENTLYYAHVGDSRIYIYAHNRLHRLTKDHSFVQRLVDLGEITEEEAEKHPRRNEITNALGLVNMAPPTLGKAPINPFLGDIFLLCSDGLTGMVSEKDIARVLKTDITPQEKATRLVEMANVAGGVDNTTIQVIAFTKDTQVVDAKPLALFKKKMLFGALGLLLLLSILAAFHMLNDSVDNEIVEATVIFDETESAPTVTEQAEDEDTVIESSNGSLTDAIVRDEDMQQPAESLLDRILVKRNAKDLNWSVIVEEDETIQIPVDSILVINNIADIGDYTILLVSPKPKEEANRVYIDGGTLYIKGEDIDEVKYEIGRKETSQSISTVATIYLKRDDDKSPSTIDCNPIPSQLNKNEYDVELKTLCNNKCT